MPERKRLTLLAALILKQIARLLDDVANMFIRQINRMHYKADEALNKYRAAHTDRTDALISLLQEITLSFKGEGSREQRLEAIEQLLEKDAANILTQCEEHRAATENNYLAFLPSFYTGRRSILFSFIETIPIISTTQDFALIDAIAFLLKQKNNRCRWLSLEDHLKAITLSFIPDKWWQLVTGYKERDIIINKVDRRFFEICVFSQIMLELKSGDLCIPGSDQFSDYRKELISEDEYQKQILVYQEQAEIPTEGALFIDHLRTKLETTAEITDKSFLKIG